MFNWHQYLKNYPDLKLAGINTSEQAWSHYQKFGKNEKRSYKIKSVILYKNHNEYIIDFSNVVTNNLGVFYSSTPTIIKKGNSFILNIRYVNYIIKEYDPVFTYSLNKYIKLDSNFNKEESYFHTYNFSKDTLKHRGLEDIKLFTHKDDIYYIGNIFRNNRSCITTNIVKNNHYIENIISFNEDKNWEKNWCFFDNHSEIGIIYKWFPLTICNITDKVLNIISENKMPDIFKQVRGSTNGTLFNNEIWFITHINENGDYIHLFVIFDLDMNLKRYSDFFKFEGKTVEFCLGLVIEDKRVIISYSTMDSTSKIMILPNLSNIKFINV
jgi:hypothetical protein